MENLEEFFRHDQKLHGEKDAHLPLRRIFHWRLETPKASKALIDLRYFGSRAVIVAYSQPGYFKFSEDFLYAFDRLCGDFGLESHNTACFEWFLHKADFNISSAKYMQFRLTANMVTREILEINDFRRFLEQLSE